MSGRSEGRPKAVVRHCCFFCRFSKTKVIQYSPKSAGPEPFYGRIDIAAAGQVRAQFCCQNLTLGAKRICNVARSRINKRNVCLRIYIS